MTIKHRIYVRKYTRKFNKVNKKKRTYKQFIGINRSGVNKIKPKYSLRKIKKHKIVKRKNSVFFLKPFILNRLDTKALSEEYSFASRDIKDFTDYATPTGPMGIHTIKNFKAFLPKNIWNKMSAREKRAHIIKRRELQSRGLLVKDKNRAGRSKICKNIIKFNARSLRPVLKILNFANRRAYLRSLVQKAKLFASRSFQDKNENTRLSLAKPILTTRELAKCKATDFKKSLKISTIKNLKKKQALSQIIYKSALPKSPVIKVRKIKYIM